MREPLKRKIFALLIVCFMLLPAFSAFAEVIPAGSVKRADYTFSADEINDTKTGQKIGSASGAAIQVRSSLELSRGADLEIAGWLLTDGGVMGYQYAIDSNGGWQDFYGENVRIFDRTDVNPGDFGYSGGGDTDGFVLTVKMSGLSVGLHDVFIRAVTKNGEYCEFLVLLNIQCGVPDKEVGNCLSIGLGKYDGDEYITSEGADAVKLTNGKSARLGDFYNFSLFKSAKISVKTQSNSGTVKLIANAAGGDREYSADLANAENGVLTVNFGKDAGRGALSVEYSGDGQIIITQILLEYENPPYYTEPYTFTLSYGKLDYFTGANYTKADSATDETVGDHLRFSLSEETADPFITFVVENAAKAELGKTLNADFHKYMVLRMLSPESNGKYNTVQLFLCAGGISGAREDSSIRFTKINDGQWHTYVIDLTDKEFWTGAVHNFRFDFLEGAYFPADSYVSLSSVTFCTTLEEAQAAADREYGTVYDEEAHRREQMFGEKTPSDVNTHINFFSGADIDCFSGMNETEVSFGRYGDLILKGDRDELRDPYASFYISSYRGLHGQTALDASKYKSIVLRVLPNTASTGTTFEMFYYTSDHGFAEGGYSASTGYEAEERWQYLIFNFTGKELWSGTIDGFRLDWATHGVKDAEMAISDMWFFESVDEAKAFAASQITEETTAEETTAVEETSAVETAEIETVSEQEVTLGSGERIETKPTETAATTAPTTESGCKSIAPAAAVIVFAVGAFTAGKRRRGGKQRTRGFLK